MTAPQWCYVAVGEIMLGTGGDWSEANIDVFANHMANLEDRDAAEEAALVMVREWRSNRPVPWAVYLDAYRRARVYATSHRALPPYAGTPITLGEHIAGLRLRAEKDTSDGEEARHELAIWQRHQTEKSTWFTALTGGA